MTAFDREAGTTASFLARSGIENPETCEPWTDSMVFGLGGGIGFMCFVFTYDGYPPIATFVTRFHTKSGGYTGFADGALGRTGATIDITGTASSPRAVKHLRASLDAEKPVLLWVDDAALRVRSAQHAATGMSPALVVAYGCDPATDAIWLSDAGRDDLLLPMAKLADARASIRAMKHRAATVSGQLDGYSLPGALRAAVAATVANMTAPEMRNFGLPGIAKWAEELADTRSKRGWSAIFGSDYRTAALGTICQASVTAAAQRRLYAVFLREAGATLNAAHLDAAAPGYDSAAVAWDALAGAAAHPAELAALANYVHEIAAAERAAIRPLADWSA